MALITITCPQCGLAKQILEERIPRDRVKVTCPNCRHQFAYIRVSEAAAQNSNRVAPEKRSDERCRLSHIIPGMEMTMNGKAEMKQNGLQLHKLLTLHFALLIILCLEHIFVIAPTAREMIRAKVKLMHGTMAVLSITNFIHKYVILIVMSFPVLIAIDSLVAKALEKRSGSDSVKLFSFIIIGFLIFLIATSLLLVKLNII